MTEYRLIIEATGSQRRRLIAVFRQLRDGRDVLPDDGAIRVEARGDAEVTVVDGAWTTTPASARGGSRGEMSRLLSRAGLTGRLSVEEGEAVHWTGFNGSRRRG